MRASVFNMQHVSKVYENGATHAAVRDVSLSGASGSVTLLLGPSGSGKTTLLLLACGLLSPSGGSSQLFGEDISTLPSRSLQRIRSRNVGIVFQDFKLIPELTVRENVALVAWFAGKHGTHARSAVQRALDAVNIGPCADKRPREISHGERQRATLARAIVNEPALIIADEPTASLDSARSEETMRFFRSASDTHRTCILVATHDARLTGFADVVVRLSDGSIISHTSNTPTA